MNREDSIAEVLFVYYLGKFTADKSFMSKNVVIGRKERNGAPRTQSGFSNSWRP